MVKLLTFHCPFCGKNLTASSVEKDTRCVHCGKLLHLTGSPDAFEDFHIIAAPLDAQPTHKIPASTGQPAQSELPTRQKPRPARLRLDREEKMIPPMLFSEPPPRHIDGKPALILFKVPPMPVILPGELMSVVEQVDEILQENIAGTPLEKRNIHLLEDPSIGIVVKVGDQVYRGIDSVADPDVYTALKAAIAQWEKEQ